MTADQLSSGGHAKPGREAWGQAYQKQGLSDWRVYKHLATQTLPECHRLHYLQMAGEMIAKAYRARDTSTDLDQILNSHVALSKFIPSFMRSPRMKEEYKGRDSQHKEVSRTADLLAREIERLAPAVDRNAMPVNAEYPWAEGTEAIPPCEFTFPSVSLLQVTQGRTFLKVLERAIHEYSDFKIS